MYQLVPVINIFVFANEYETSIKNIETNKPATIDDVRQQPEAIMAYSEEMRQHKLALKRFLRENLYRHYRVLRMSAKSKRIIIALFNVFMEDSQLLPTEHRKKATQLGSTLGESGKARIIADYIAGMTDRYAISEYDKIFKPEHLT